MLAPHIKKKVDKLWDRFWSAGLTNPLVAVEQITYLLFLKRLEDIDVQRVGRGLTSIYADHDNCRWSYIRQEKTNPKHLIEVVFPWLRTLDDRLKKAVPSATSSDAPSVRVVGDTMFIETKPVDQREPKELSNLHGRMADAYFQLDPNKGQVLADAIDLIDQLFSRAGEGSSAQDIMGDTFEYLLSEMATAGKNGQFRTPRHLIRFMVELLDPEPGQRIIDPAAGTGGFLFSAQQYLMRKYSAQENLVLEWDGTPHRTDGAAATPEQYKAIHQGTNFVGLDNDRTMTRIGWMNLVLHGVDDPQLMQGDSLSKRDGKPEIANLLATESYQFVLANPPFTGTVDTNDLEKDSKLFPRAADRGRKKDDAITNKSELLFLWLMLDLLEVGGRCAVIIPEGVLFGNTDAHVRLRRELLTEHVIEAVISLPGGVFQPYTGVKTSILIFRKETKRDDKQTFTGGTMPRTEHVWFYEVEEDGFSPNAKRDPRPGQRNDLWDALEKFKVWRNQGREGAQENQKALLQPSFHAERWRQALLRDTDDKLTPAGEAFASLSDTSMWDGQVWGIHELFTELPIDPKAAEAKVRTQVSKGLHDLIVNYLSIHTQPLLDSIQHATDSKERIDRKAILAEWHRAIRVPLQEYRRAVRDLHNLFEKEDSPALRIWKELTAYAERSAPDFLEHIVSNAPDEQIGTHTTISDLQPKLTALAREVSKLDGFDVTLRSLAVDLSSELKASKHWVVAVRAWARNDKWVSSDGKSIGSHDADGLVRPHYVQAMLDANLYDETAALKDGLLDPDCIEARDWSLSAGQYKPFDFTQLKSDKSINVLIGELRTTEQQIIKGLDKLLAMAEGRE
jgi:type I restriction enzyme M protein